METPIQTAQPNAAGNVATGSMVDTPMTAAVRNKDLLRVCELEALGFTMTDAQRLLAAICGDLGLLHHIKDKYGQVHPRTAVIAALLGNKLALEFALHHGSCPLDHELWIQASWNESPFYNEKLRAENIYEEHITYPAETYRYLLNARCSWSPEVVHHAILNQTPTFLRFALQHGCPYNFTAIEAAILGEPGTVRSTLALLHSSGNPWPSEWLSDALSLAFDVDDQQTVEFLHSLGAQWPAELVQAIPTDPVVIDATELCLLAVRHDDAVALGRLLRNPEVNTRAVAQLVAESGRTQVIMAAHGEFRSMFNGSLLIRMAASRGNWQYVLSACAAFNLPLSIDHANLAAYRGHLRCLQELRKAGCPCDASTCAQAAAGGQLECLRFLRESGCPWDERTVQRATLHPLCREYVQRRDCPQIPVLSLAVALMVSLMLMLALVCELVLEAVLALVRLVFAYTVDGPQILASPAQATAPEPAPEPAPAPVTAAAVEKAARKGQYRLLRALFEQHGGPVTDDLCTAAARGGSISCMEFVLQHMAAVPTTVKLMNYAARAGQSDMMTYLHERRFPCFEDTAQLAARSGNHRCLQVLLQISTPRWTPKVCAAAAVSGSVECLRFVRDQGCGWNADTCVAVARVGHLQCLQYLVEHGCLFDARAHAAAEAGGHHEVAQYLTSVGCLDPVHLGDVDWSTVTPKIVNVRAAQGNHLFLAVAHIYVPHTFTAQTFSSAAAGGHIQCLELLFSVNCPVNRRAAERAAEGGHLQCLIFLHEHQCPWGKRTVAAARRCGHVECLNYALDHGCPDPGEAEMKAAALGGDLQALEYGFSIRLIRPSVAILEQATVGGSVVCFDYVHSSLGGGYVGGRFGKAAARAGHVELLRHLHGLDCRLTAQTYAGAAAGGHLECLEYLNDVKCPRDASALVAALQTTESDLCLSFLIAHGCRWTRRALAEATHIDGGAFLRLLVSGGCNIGELLIVEVSVQGQSHSRCRLGRQERQGRQGRVRLPLDS